MGVSVEEVRARNPNRAARAIAKGQDRRRGLAACESMMNAAAYGSVSAGLYMSGSASFIESHGRLTEGQ